MDVMKVIKLVTECSICNLKNLISSKLNNFMLREEGVLRTAMSRHCVSRTPDRT